MSRGRYGTDAWGLRFESSRNSFLWSDVEVPPDEEVFVYKPEPKLLTSRDPFLDKCIHGMEGARFQDGVLVNPKCEVCQLYPS